MKRDLGDGYELDDDRVADRPRRGARATSAARRTGRRDGTRERQDALIDASEHVVGLYKDGAQVGFARAVDCFGAGFVYLADVYVLEEHRGRGLGVELVREIVENGPFADRRWMLHTRDAHALYEKFGFGAERAADRALRAARLVRLRRAPGPLERVLEPGASRPAIGSRSCASESRSRTVTVSSSSVWSSIVNAHGVPISSWRR